MDRREACFSCSRFDRAADSSHGLDAVPLDVCEQVGVCEPDGFADFDSCYSAFLPEAANVTRARREERGRGVFIEKSFGMATLGAVSRLS